MVLSAIAVIFILGYLAIALEHKIKVSKAASALFLGTLLWLRWLFNSDIPHKNLQHPNPAVDNRMANFLFKCGFRQFNLHHSYDDLNAQTR